MPICFIYLGNSAFKLTYFARFLFDVLKGQFIERSHFTQLYTMSRSATMFHYMKSVKRSKLNKHGVLKRARVTLDDINPKNPTLLGSPLGFFGLLPREMRFRVFGFTPLADLGQLSLASRLFTDEVMNYLHNNEALLVIIPNIHLNSEEESSQVFVTMKTEYCWNHFKDLGKYHEIFT